jgi:hypothetical protein
MQAHVLADKDATTHSRTGSSRKRLAVMQKQDFLIIINYEY